MQLDTSRDFVSAMEFAKEQARRRRSTIYLWMDKGGNWHIVTSAPSYTPLYAVEPLSE